MIEPTARKHPQKEAKPSDTRCRGLGALSCSDFVEANRIVQLKCCARRGLHGQRVWDAAQQVLARQEALYIQRHCLQVQGPLQEHTTFRDSLVYYTSPPGGVYVLGVLPGVSIIQFVGCRGRSGFTLPGPGRPAQSTGLGCPDSQASRARHSHTGLCRSCKAAGYSGVTVRKFQRPALRFPCSGSGAYCSSNAPLFLLVGLCRSLCACIKPWGGPFCKRAERGRRCSGM